MNSRLLLIAIERETDIILARQRTRQIAALVGFDNQDQTRITTAVSEIVRNALEYGRGGRIEYRLHSEVAPQTLEIIVQDKGAGIAALDSILAGTHNSATGMGIGILGARRLMDDFAIETHPGQGTSVHLKKNLPHRAPLVAAGKLREIAQALTRQEGLDPMAEITRQNKDMIVQLEELGNRQEELEGLNQELQDTNRGVVALYAELNDRADHLRQADELKSRFLSNMSHEFRTPLNSILALSRLLLSRSDGELTLEQEKQVQFIRKGAENLTELVNDLLDLAKVEAGKTVIAPVEFTVTDLFSTLRGMLRPLLVGDALALTFEDPAGLPPVFTDEGKVSQILRNFISNALKFTERGEVRIWAEWDATTDRITFHVRDTGIGIAEKDIELIWQEFAQIASAVQNRVKGTGLGLPLSRKLAELLRGSVAVESAPGLGSIFSLTIPRFFLLRAESTEIEAQWQLVPGRIPVLALEDNAADAFTYERFLANSRYQVIPARTIADAKRAVERFRFGAMIIDIMLEIEESWRFLLEMKQRDATRHIPIIVSSTTRDERKARNLGADDYLDKPVDPARLLRVLDELTGGNSVTKVLLVDDEEVFRYLVRQLLPHGNFELKEFATASAGLAEVRDNRPDVILLDLNMEPIDGIEFLDRLAKDSAGNFPPTIVITSSVPSDDERRRLSNASMIVSKSDLSSEVLVAAIQQAVGARASAPS